MARNSGIWSSWLLRAGAVAALAAASAAGWAQEGSLAQIQQKLEAEFKLTRTTADRSDIVTAGDIVVLRKDNIKMNSAVTTPAPENTFKDGRLTQNTWANSWRNAIARSNNGDQNVPFRLFVAGEKCWITGIEVREDGAYLMLYSDPYNDMRYYGILKFPFNKKAVPATDEVLREVAEVVTAQPADAKENNNAQQAPAAPQQSAQVQAPVQAAAPAPMQAIAPPPPPADAAPPTIAIGQTKDQVVAAFGQPTRKAALGAKEIYIYKDMKVTFTSGKVSNVE
jgi:hypothetical protein